VIAEALLEIEKALQMMKEENIGTDSKEELSFIANQLMDQSGSGVA